MRPTGAQPADHPYTQGTRTPSAPTPRPEEAQAATFKTCGGCKRRPKDRKLKSWTCGDQGRVGVACMGCTEWQATKDTRDPEDVLLDAAAGEKTSPGAFFGPAFRPGRQEASRQVKMARKVDRMLDEAADETPGAGSANQVTMSPSRALLTPEARAQIKAENMEMEARSQGAATRKRQPHIRIRGSGG